MAVGLVVMQFWYGYGWSDLGSNLGAAGMVASLAQIPLAVALLRTPSIWAFIIFLALVVSALLLLSIHASESNWALEFVWSLWLISGLLLVAARLGAIPDYTVSSVAGIFGLQSYVTWIRAALDIREGMSILLVSVYLVIAALEVIRKRTVPVLTHPAQFWFDDIQSNDTIFGSIRYAFMLASNLLLRILHFVCDMGWGFLQILGAYLYWFGAASIEVGWKQMSEGWVWRVALRLAAHMVLFDGFCLSLAAITPGIIRYLSSTDVWSSPLDLLLTALWFFVVLLGVAVTPLIWNTAEKATKVWRVLFGAAMIVLAATCSGFLAYPILRVMGRPAALGIFSLTVLAVVSLFSAYRSIMKFNE